MKNKNKRETHITSFSLDKVKFMELVKIYKWNKTCTDKKMFIQKLHVEDINTRDLNEIVCEDVQNGLKLFTIYSKNPGFRKAVDKHSSL
jgi:hypothetical protein